MITLFFGSLLLIAFLPLAGVMLIPTFLIFLFFVMAGRFTIDSVIEGGAWIWSTIQSLFSGDLFSGGGGFSLGGIFDGIGDRLLGIIPDWLINIVPDSILDFFEGLLGGSATVTETVTNVIPDADQASGIFDSVISFVTNLWPF